MSRYRLKGTSGSVINQAFGLSSRLVIGSDAACDIPLQEPNVARQHAEILMDAAGGIVLLNLDAQHQTLCNGKPVNQRALVPGDEIRIGTCRWLLQAPGLRPQRVLTEDAIRPGRAHWPWLLALAVVAGAVLVWQRGWLPF